MLRSGEPPVHPSQNLTCILPRHTLFLPNDPHWVQFRNCPGPGQTRKWRRNPIYLEYGSKDPLRPNFLPHSQRHNQILQRRSMLGRLQCQSLTETHGLHVISIVMHSLAPVPGPQSRRPMSPWLINPYHAISRDRENTTHLRIPWCVTSEGYLELKGCLQCVEHRTTNKGRRTNSSKSNTSFVARAQEPEC